ncbi:MAG TPA: response regulator [Verrucomicrobiae bacterium]|nr:response regulator [Verrucomicrobiae bacterium]
MEQKVLFVDDDPHWRDIVSLSFKEAGYEVITAADATEGMSRAEGVKLGLIILDLNLAGENGLVLMRFMKRNHPDVPVLLYTATDQDDEAIRKMLNEGADQYLPKGSIEELLVAAGSYLK